ncbi:MAG: Asp-tRNA(Asn)/Glu-tRNA(Gln) amidotransferase subunit GatA, partial [bacterium]|nr:Asp-tRNA(Asn)/Glu-tRNA(Gln) amidotransferase subunit GatA [bacterium]
ASAGSKILENYVASYDAFVVEKLKAQHAVFLGRTNMDEFAMGSSTENSAFGVTKNPHDLKRVPGGSSGGSAAAVAAGLALAALGSDTGGSVRQPAALCGVIGLKPTYGTVSRRGLIAMGSSLDQIGTFGKNTEDARLLFEAVRGHDGMDSTSLADDFFTDTANGELKVIGVPRNFLKEGVDADVLERFEKVLTNLASAGYEVRDIDLPNVRYALPAYYIIMPAEASTNLARFDSLRYGVAHEGDSLLEDYKKTRGEGFGMETRRRILIGTFVLSSGYADAYYRKAEAVRELIRADFAHAFENVDVIATPTSPVPAFKIGERATDPLAMYAADIFTVPVNMAGVPAVSVPMGTVERDGTHLPTGLQFIAPHGAEGRLFVLGASVETS